MINKDFYEYRIWLKEEAKMANVSSLHWSPDGKVSKIGRYASDKKYSEIYYDPFQVVLMKNTGITDINNVYLYEKDLFRFTKGDLSNKEIFRIEKERGGFGFWRIRYPYEDIKSFISLNGDSYFYWDIDIDNKCTNIEILDLLIN